MLAPSKGVGLMHEVGCRLRLKFSVWKNKRAVESSRTRGPEVWFFYYLTIISDVSDQSSVFGFVKKDLREV